MGHPANSEQERTFLKYGGKQHSDLHKSSGNKEMKGGTGQEDRRKNKRSEQVRIKEGREDKEEKKE